MTGLNAYFSLLKVDIPYQKIIVYVDHFDLYRKTVSSICSLCLCVISNGHPSTPLPYMVCGDPESGTDQSRSVHTLFGTGYTHGASRVYLQMIIDVHVNVNVKNSSAKVTCNQTIRPHQSLSIASSQLLL